MNIQFLNWTCLCLQLVNMQSSLSTLTGYIQITPHKWLMQWIKWLEIISSPVPYSNLLKRKNTFSYLFNIGFNDHLLRVIPHLFKYLFTDMLLQEMMCTCIFSIIVRVKTCGQNGVELCMQMKSTSFLASLLTKHIFHTQKKKSNFQRQWCPIGQTLLKLGNCLLFI